jgi:hypothetical protein
MSEKDEMSANREERDTDTEWGKRYRHWCIRRENHEKWEWQWFRNIFLILKWQLKVNGGITILPVHQYDP